MKRQLFSSLSLGAFGSVNAVSCDVTERDLPTLSQTLRGQQGKRERLGTRLGYSNSQASNLTKYHHKINHLCKPHLVYSKVPYKVTLEYNPAQSTRPRSKAAHHETFGFKAKLSINSIGNVSVKTSFSKTITAISV